MAASRTCLEQAYELICAFYLKCCEGEESQNLTLGGVDAEGKDAANPLSVLLVMILLSFLFWRQLRMAPTLSIKR